MWMATLVAPLQVVTGDLHGLNTLEHQPVKVAAMEGYYHTRTGAPLILFGVPDNEAAEIRYTLELPKLGSLILKHDPDAQVVGLDAWPREDWPNVALVFWSFRVMVGIGLCMVAVGLWSAFARLRGQLYTTPGLHRSSLFLGPAGFVAIVAGWIVTEAGRQPYIIYGLLRTAESLSPVDTPAVGASLIAFIVIYLGVFGAGWYYLLRLMQQPLIEAADREMPDPRPSRDAGRRIGQRFPEAD
jgi:cytochrome d ubiquinol oxidase subunit I